MESPRGGQSNKIKAGDGMLEQYTDMCNCGECTDLYYCRSCTDVYTTRDEAVVHSLMHTMNGDEQLTRALN